MILQTILLVDNEPGYLKKYASFFLEKKIPFKILTASDGEMAVKIAASESPDIIIMAWKLPVMDGLTAIKKLKENPELKDIPVIIAAGNRISSKDIRLCIEAGASDYIRKPINQNELITRLKSQIQISNYNKILKDQKQKIPSDQEKVLLREKELLNELCEQMSTMVKFLFFERQKIILLIRELKNGSDTENKNLEYMNSILTQNTKVFNHYKSICQLFQQENDFVKRLLKQHPSLLPSEIELCLLVKRNLQSKEIACMTFKCTNTIKVARSKLRNKLALKPNDNLVNYLIGI